MTIIRWLIVGLVVIASCGTGLCDELVGHASVNRTSLDINSVSGILQIAFEAFAAFFAAHGSYSLITGKTAPTELPNGITLDYTNDP